MEYQISKASFSDSQSSAVSDFQSQAEINTLTRGSYPPKDGDTTSWADGVKTSPVPIQYDLMSIRELFTSEQMGQYMKRDTLQRVKQKLLEAEYDYCIYLAQKHPGLQCRDDSRFIFGGVKTVENEAFSVSSISDQVSCSDKCRKTTYCLASSFVIFDLSRVCYLDNGGTEAMISLDADISAVLEIFPQAPDYFVSLVGYRYDLSAMQSQRYKIKSPVS